MPMISFSTHATVRCAVCRGVLLAQWDDVTYTMNVEPCHDCLNNAKKNAIEDNLLEAYKIHYVPYADNAR